MRSLPDSYGAVHRGDLLIELDRTRRPTKNIDKLHRYDAFLTAKAAAKSVPGARDYLVKPLELRRGRRLRSARRPALRDERAGGNAHSASGACGPRNPT